MVKGPSGLPPVDRLLQFLVDSSGDGTEVVRCANCDLECGKQAGAPGVQWGAEGARLHHVLRGSPNSGLSSPSLRHLLSKTEAPLYWYGDRTTKQLT